MTISDKMGFLKSFVSTLKRRIILDFVEEFDMKMFVTTLKRRIIKIKIILPPPREIDFDFGNHDFCQTSGAISSLILEIDFGNQTSGNPTRLVKTRGTPLFDIRFYLRTSVNFI